MIEPRAFAAQSATASAIRMDRGRVVREQRDLERAVYLAERVNASLPGR